MLEIVRVKLLAIGVVTAIVMAPKHWDVVERWLNQLRRSWS